MAPSSDSFELKILDLQSDMLRKSWCVWRLNYCAKGCSWRGNFLARGPDTLSRGLGLNSDIRRMIQRIKERVVEMLRALPDTGTPPRVGIP